MNKELQSIIRNLQNTLGGQPWYGKPIFALIDEVDPATANIKTNNKDHSQTELLYHMINWAGFTLSCVAGNAQAEHFEKNDWQTLDPEKDTWQKGVEEFKSIHEQLITQLQTKDDLFLKEIAPHRNYNFRFMLNGLIQHNIYHAGQIAFITKHIP